MSILTTIPESQKDEALTLIDPLEEKRSRIAAVFDEVVSQPAPPKQSTLKAFDERYSTPFHRGSLAEALSELRQHRDWARKALSCERDYAAGALRYQSRSLLNHQYWVSVINAVIQPKCSLLAMRRGGLWGCDTDRWIEDLRRLYDAHYTFKVVYQELVLGPHECAIEVSKTGRKITDMAIPCAYLVIKKSGNLILDGSQKSADETELWLAKMGTSPAGVIWYLFNEAHHRATTEIEDWPIHKHPHYQAQWLLNTAREHS